MRHQAHLHTCKNHAHMWNLCTAMQVWDLGGQANLRPSWATYYQQTDCIILVKMLNLCHLPGN